MNRRICVCCGEPMSAASNKLSRDPNLCASCSSLADGLDDYVISDAPIENQTQPDLEDPPAPARPASLPHHAFKAS